MALWLSVLKSKLPPKGEQSSLKVLAKQAHVKLSKLSEWLELGITPSSKDIKKLAQYYSLDEYDVEEIKQHLANNHTLTYAFFYTITGISSSTLNDWITKGKQPHIDSLNRISAWLKIPVAALLLEVETLDAPDVKIVSMLERLTHDQKQQLVNQMETMLEQHVPTPPHS